MDRIYLTLFIVSYLILGAMGDSSEDAAAECLDKEDVDDVVAEAFINGSLELASKEPKLKCFAACILETYGLLENCHFNYLKASLLAKGDGEDEVAGAVERCKDSAKVTQRCECAFEVFSCISEQLGIEDEPIPPGMAGNAGMVNQG